jgi:hypothetical protein
MCGLGFQSLGVARVKNDFRKNLKVGENVIYDF